MLISSHQPLHKLDRLYFISTVLIIVGLDLYRKYRNPYQFFITLKYYYTVGAGKVNLVTFR